MLAGGAQHVVRRDVLEHVSRALLARLVEPFVGFLDAHGVALADLAASDQNDRALVRRLFALVDSPDGAPSPAPAPMRERLAALSALASSAGREAIARADGEGTVAREGKSDEDLAAIVILEHPDVFARARPGLAVESANGFTAYRGADARAIDLAGQRAKIEHGFGLFCQARDRTALCEIVVREGARFVDVDVLHGRTPAARDHIDPESLTLRQSTDVIAQSAKMILDKQAHCLLVRAGHASLKDGLRRVVGEVCTGDPDFFTTRAVYNLLPLADPATCARGADVPGVDAIELRAVTIRAMNGSPASFGPFAEDLRAGPWANAVKDAFRVGAPTAAKVALFLRGRKRASIVDIKLPGTLEYARRDAELARAVNDFLVARGIAVLEAAVDPSELEVAE